MRFTAVALLGILALVASTPLHHQQSEPQTTVDKQYLQRQKDVLLLYKFVQQPISGVEVPESVNQDQSNYNKANVVEDFLEVYQNNPLHRGEIFSVLNREHLHYAIALFRVLYYAKTYDVFYKNALWARNNVNQGVYVYALSVALVHRQDTYGLSLPPIYEVYPQYFFNTHVIEQAQQWKQIHHQLQNNNDYHTIYDNKTEHVGNVHSDESMKYYTEDVGINAFYYNYHVYYPFWLNSSEFNFDADKRGELFYYVHQQLLARYYLERLSNHLGQVPVLDSHGPIVPGYNPNLQYPNGVAFPSRPESSSVHDYVYDSEQGSNKYAYMYVMSQDFERRINDAADLGLAINNNKKKVEIENLNVFGNLVEGNGDSPNYHFYGNFLNFVRRLLGFAPQTVDSHHVVPSVLEHYETSLRDPVYYQLLKNVLWFFRRYTMYNQRPYTKEELSFPGVTVENVEFDRLVTYFDQFYADVSNALHVSPEEFQQDNVRVRVQQQRLNHKPFTYRIQVNSDKAQKASVKIYIGPKYNVQGHHFSWEANRLNFVEFDAFIVDLNAGQNTINRNSHQNYFYHEDRPTVRETYDRVVAALKENTEYKVGPSDYFLGFQERYLIPKGNYEGQEYQIYVIVSPYVPYSGAKQNEQQKFIPMIGAGNLHFDNYPMGYPFNRHIHNEQMFLNVSNSYVYTTKVYHRDAEAVNAPHHQ